MDTLKYRRDISSRTDYTLLEKELYSELTTMVIITLLREGNTVDTMIPNYRKYLKNDLKLPGYNDSDYVRQMQYYLRKIYLDWDKVKDCELFNVIDQKIVQISSDETAADGENLENFGKFYRNPTNGPKQSFDIVEALKSFYSNDINEKLLPIEEIKKKQDDLCEAFVPFINSVLLQFNEKRKSAEDE